MTDIGETSDGYHTFNELYEHRHALYMALAGYNAGAWKSQQHADGTSWDGWFVCGLDTPKGAITYHLPMRLWDDCPGTSLEVAPAWDGHTSDDVVTRLRSL